MLAVVKVAIQQETVQREKLMKYLKQRNQKRQKKEVKKKKSAHEKENRMDLNQQNQKKKHLMTFLKKKDLKKWHYVIDMVSQKTLKLLTFLLLRDEMK